MTFFSQQTLTFCASFSPSHFFATFFFSKITLLFFVLLTCSTHSVVYTVCPSLCFASSSRLACTPPLSVLTPAPSNVWLFLFYSSQQSVSSPPLSLAQSSQPYFLHSALPSYRPGYSNSQPFADPRPHSHVGSETADEPRDTQHGSNSACSQGGDDSNTDLSPGFHYDSLADLRLDSPCLNGSNLSAHRDFASDSMCNLDSLYCSDSEKQHGARTKSDTPISGVTEAPGCATPYKNMDVVMTYSNSISAADSLYSEKHTDQTTARLYKELPPLPSYYLYHPKNCPLHRGAPPRLSPIGALSPPQRSGAPPSGTAGSRLSSPLFPRSHTLPALAAPLYYPNLYPPIPPRAPPLPPKLHQAPLQSHVASKTSLSLSLSLHL